MARGDVNYVLVLAGSAATSIAGAHDLFGAYNSALSALHEDESLHIQITPLGAAEMFVGNGANLSNNIGLKLYATSSGTNLPPMRAALASQLKMGRGVSNVDVTHMFAVWARRP